MTKIRTGTKNLNVYITVYGKLISGLYPYISSITPPPPSLQSIGIHDSQILPKSTLPKNAFIQVSTFQADSFGGEYFQDLLFLQAYVKSRPHTTQRYHHLNKLYFNITENDSTQVTACLTDRFPRKRILKVYSMYIPL